MVGRVSAAVEFWKSLIRVEAPLFVCDPGRDGREFLHPSRWTEFDVEGSAQRVAGFKPAGAVCAVLGDAVAVLDVDTKNGADIAQVEQLLDGIGCRAYAVVATPSGGRHYYVPGHPDLPTVHAASERVGFTGFPGVELLSHGTNVFLPGTARPKYDGGGYVVLRDDLAVLADGGDEDSALALLGWVAQYRAVGGETFDAAPVWAGGAPDRRQRAYLDAVLTNCAAKVAATGSGGRNLALYEAGLALGNYVAGAGLDEAAAVESLQGAADRCGLTAEDGPRSVLASIRSGIRNGKARPRAVPPATDALLGASAPTAVPVSAPVVVGDDGLLPVLRDLLVGLRSWHHLPDPTHVVAALAAAATRDAAGEPCWLLLVAPPSSGKTEAVRLLDGAVDDRLDEVTAAGLLGWSRGKPSKPTGVLARVGSQALVTLGDLSTLLATSDRGGRDQVFAMLRRVYDGHTSRDVSPPGRTEADSTQLTWTGRLTVVACVTGAIDRAAAHNAELGPRWLYVRLPERSTEAKRAASRLARAGGLAARRREAAEQVAGLLAVARSLVIDDVPDGLADVIEDAALVTTWGRAAVPRNGYGRREIEGVPVIEEPMRLVQQLGALARGATALGLPAAAVHVLVRRLALDSMPEARRAVLAALSDGEPLSTSAVARRAGLDRKVARFTLEDLAAVGVVSNDRTDDDNDETGPVHWFLEGEDGGLIAAVVNAHKRAGGWDEMWELSTPPPQKGEGVEAPTGIQPTFRPTPTTGDPTCSTCGGRLGRTEVDAGLCIRCQRIETASAVSA